MNMKSIVPLLLAVLLLPAGPASAKEAPPSKTDLAGVESFVKTNVNQVLELLRHKELEEVKRKDRVMAVVNPLFDFPLMAKLVLGRSHWPKFEKAQRALRQYGIDGEIVVADNGSTDGSQAIASRMGARLVHIDAKGYGNALRGGIAEAQGKYVIMGDADDSYNFLDIPRFLEHLRTGHELVLGCRLPSGGGTVAEGAMPPLHREYLSKRT